MDFDIHILQLGSLRVLRLKEKVNYATSVCYVYFLVIFIGGKQLVGKYLSFSLASESKQDIHSDLAKMTFHKLLVD